MAITSSGQISINDIMTELSISGQTALNDEDVRGLIDKASGAQMSMSEWYGAANAFAFTVSSAYTTPQDVNTLATAAGWDGTVPIVMTISSGVGFHSNNNSTAALNINVANTSIINSGYIAGDGGKSGQAGGDAVLISASGVSITNNSGAFLAGGGGSGGGTASQAGGGAGQSTIGSASSNGASSSYYYFNAGCQGYVTKNWGAGGDQGGGGSGGHAYQEMACQFGSNAGGHTGVFGVAPNPANGGSILSASSNSDGPNKDGGYGGGGWGRQGLGSGGAGGYAVKYNGNSVTLTNNGTVYGTTG
tara:strand:+ start:231 stop:1142 length:912 start_codon:yes stop_codon:yes gene_type:complete